MKTHRPGRRLARGITLIESLVAILLISMSALAYAALQLRGLSGNSSAMWRSKAVQLTLEMADRMRANRVAVLAGSYDSLTAPSALPSCGSTTACTPTQTATMDYAAWSTTVGAELPTGSGVVCLDSTPDDGTAASPACDGLGTTYAVKVFWTERSTASRVAMEMRL
jgi:type IV pilus assembly protein PilV